MSFVPPAVDHVAKKIARTPGVEGAYIGKDGAIDAVLETAFDRQTRSEVLGIGMRAMVPVRVFYRMPDGQMIGEDEARAYESLEDFYTRIHVAGFAGDEPKAPPEDVAGDAYGDVDVDKDVDDRDQYGQLKLTRIRGTGRGRPVVGWKYGSKSLKVGDKVKFKRPCCLQWTMGRTVSVSPGAVGKVSQMASKAAVAYLSMGGNDRIELPVHAIGHVYDVMVDPTIESTSRLGRRLQERQSVMTPQMKRMMNVIGFGRLPGMDDTPTNAAKFTGPDQPDLIGYQTPDGSEEDMLAPPSSSKDSKNVGDSDDDDRTVKVVQREPRIKVRQGGAVRKKTVLLGRR